MRKPMLRIASLVPLAAIYLKGLRIYCIDCAGVFSLTLGIAFGKNF